MSRTPIKLLVAAMCIAVGAVAISLGRPVPERPAASVLDAGSRASIASRWQTRVDTVRKGEPLVAVLERAGVPREDANRALLSASSLDLRRVRAGTTITTRTNPDSDRNPETLVAGRFSFWRSAFQASRAKNQGLHLSGRRHASSALAAPFQAVCGKPFVALSFLAFAQPFAVHVLL